MTDKEKKIDDILTRGVGEFIDPDDSFREKLIKKVRGEYDDDIVIKFGVDPTRPDIHLGHAVVFRKLRQLQDMGCKVIFLVGDFTALIGDPTGKSKVRPEIEQKEIEQNMQTFVDQIDKILRTDDETFSWIRNSDWYLSITDIMPSKEARITQKITDKDGKDITINHDPTSFIGRAVLYYQTRMQRTHLHQDEIRSITLRGLLWTLRSVTHSQLINRDMFQDRLDDDRELYMHEMMYPVLQGIDSHVLAHIYGSCDLEIGGTDQTFNMMMARDVMKYNNQEKQSVLSLDLLVGTDGTEKMSKSLDNYIAITDEPHDMYGKIMSIPDESIAHFFELATYTPLSEVEKIRDDIESGDENPKELKMRLAREVTAIYHGKEAAQEAEKTFEKTFSEGNIPDDITEVGVDAGERLMDVVTDAGLVSSNSQFRRLVDQGAITNTDADEKITDHHYSVNETATFKIGKKRFIKVDVS